MYFRIGIVGSDSSCIKELFHCIDKWAETYNHTLYKRSFSEAPFYNPAFFQKFDIIFIDLSPQTLLLTKTLRVVYSFTKIVFLASLGQNFPVDSSQKPIYYLLKPLSQDKTITLLTETMNQLDSGDYLYQYRNQTIRIPYSNILYFSSRNHQTEIITFNKVYKEANSLGKIRLRLPPQFQQCHRTAVVNLKHICSLKCEEILLTNQERIPVSATYREQVKAAFIKFHSSKSKESLMAPDIRQ